MKYKFVAAYYVHGMALRPNQDDETIYRDDEVHVFLTVDTTDALAVLDRQDAIGMVMLHALVQKPVEGDLRYAWKEFVKDALDRRKERYRSSGFVVIEVDGDIDVTLPERCEQVDDYKVCFDAYDKRKLAEVLHPNVASALSAIRLAGDLEYRFERIASGSYLVDADGLVVHSISFSGGGQATVSQVISDVHIEAMRAFIAPLRLAPELEQALDLHAQSLNRQETELRAFMAAWNSLEQFVKEVKKTRYGPMWNAEKKDKKTAPERIATLDDIPNPDSAIARSFGKMACYIGGNDIAADIAEFVELKDIRNGLSHQLKDKDLPTDRVHKLMDKYLKGHLLYK